MPTSATHMRQLFRPVAPHPATQAIAAHDECPAAVRLSLLGNSYRMFAGPSHAPRAHLEHLASPLTTAYVCVRRAFARWLFLDRVMVNCRVGRRALCACRLGLRIFPRATTLS